MCSHSWSQPYFVCTFSTLYCMSVHTTTHAQGLVGQRQPLPPDTNEGRQVEGALLDVVAMQTTTAHQVTVTLVTKRHNPGLCGVHRILPKVVWNRKKNKYSKVKLSFCEKSPTLETFWLFMSNWSVIQGCWIVMKITIHIITSYFLGGPCNWRCSVVSLFHLVLFDSLMALFVVGSGCCKV